MPPLSQIENLSKKSYPETTIPISPLFGQPFCLEANFS
jgi:hypothetical protein